MPTYPPFRKVFEGIATREQMFALFNRHSDTPGVDPLSGVPYASEWFEISAGEYHFMLGLLPPLFQRTGMFGMSVYKAGNITSVFFALSIDGRIRYFHAYCDMSAKGSAARLRDVIIERESRPVRAMTRTERLDHIWSTTHADYRGYAGERWPERDRGARTITVYGGPQGTVLKLLDDLTEAQISAKLPVHLRYLPAAIAA